MNFLESVGVTSATLEKVREHNGEALVSDLYLNRIDIKNIIKYFQSIGIKVIDDLLIFVVDLFFKDINEIKAKVEQYGISEFVEEVNNDYFEINKII